MDIVEAKEVLKEMIEELKDIYIMGISRYPEDKSFYEIYNKYSKAIEVVLKALDKSIQKEVIENKIEELDYAAEHEYNESLREYYLAQRVGLEDLLIEVEENKI